MDHRPVPGFGPGPGFRSGPGSGTGLGAGVRSGPGLGPAFGCAAVFPVHEPPREAEQTPEEEFRSTFCGRSPGHRPNTGHTCST